MHDNIKNILKTEQSRLRDELRTIERALAVFDGGTKTTKVRKSGKGRIKITDAVLTSLTNGDLSVADIRSEASKITGKNISSSSLSNTLVALKKKKAVKSVSRGVYSLAKK